MDGRGHDCVADVAAVAALRKLADEAVTEVLNAWDDIPNDDRLPQSVVDAWYERCFALVQDARKKARAAGWEKGERLLRDIDRQLNECYETGDPEMDDVTRNDIWFLLGRKMDRLTGASCSDGR